MHLQNSCLCHDRQLWLSAHFHWAPDTLVPHFLNEALNCIIHSRLGDMWPMVSHGFGRIPANTQAGIRMLRVAVKKKADKLLRCISPLAFWSPSVLRKLRQFSHVNIPASKVLPLPLPWPCCPALGFQLHATKASKQYCNEDIVQPRASLKTSAS